MAQIEVFPLSINGVAPPLNLLSQAFTKTLNPEFQFYPLDLAANPNYGHAVQFTVFDTSYKIDNIGSALLKGKEGISSILNLDSISSIFNPTNWKVNAATEKTLSTISLYMPDTLQMNYDHDWSQVSLTQTFGKGAFIGAAIADSLAQGKNGSSIDSGNPANLITGKGLATGLAQIAGEAGFAGTGADLGTVVGNALRQVPNPQLQMLYKGTELRQFQFQFKFTPASKREASAIEKIIETFQYYSAPQLLGSASHQYLKPPELFKINFLFVGGNGLQNVVSNFFKNIGTNILTSQLEANMFGGSQQSNLSPDNKARVFEIYNPCALSNIAIDYAPNGWAAHEDGAPVETTLTLTFKEVDIVTKDNIRPTSGAGGGPIGDIWRGVASPFKLPDILK